MEAAKKKSKRVLNDFVMALPEGFDNRGGRRRAQPFRRRTAAHLLARCNPEETRPSSFWTRPPAPAWTADNESYISRRSA
jgi:hypothetical protein